MQQLTFYLLSDAGIRTHDLLTANIMTMRFRLHSTLFLFFQIDGRDGPGRPGVASGHRPVVAVHEERRKTGPARAAARRNRPEQVDGRKDLRRNAHSRKLEADKIRNDDAVHSQVFAG